MSGSADIIIQEAESITEEVLDAMGHSELAAFLKIATGLASDIIAAIQRKQITLADEVRAADAAAQAALVEKFGK